MSFFQLKDSALQFISPLSSKEEWLNHYVKYFQPSTFVPCLDVFIWLINYQNSWVPCKCALTSYCCGHSRGGHGHKSRQQRLSLPSGVGHSYIILPISVTKYQYGLVWLGFYPSSLNIRMIKISVYCSIPVLAKGVA